MKKEQDNKIKLSEEGLQKKAGGVDKKNECGYYLNEMGRPVYSCPPDDGKVP